MNEALLLTKITINNIYICKGSLVPPCRYTTTESTSELLQKIIMKKKNLCSTRNVYTKQLNLRQGCNLILQPASQIYKLDADLKKKKKKKLYPDEHKTQFATYHQASYLLSHCTLSARAMGYHGSRPLCFQSHQHSREPQGSN